MSPQLQDELVSSEVGFHNLVAALRGNLGFVCTQTFAGSVEDDYLPYPVLDFSVSVRHFANGSVQWFQQLLEVWNRSQLIKWQFVTDGNMDHSGYCRYQLRPELSNKERYVACLTAMRRAAGQLATFFNAWKTAITE